MYCLLLYRHVSVILFYFILIFWCIKCAWNADKCVWLVDEYVTMCLIGWRTCNNVFDWLICYLYKIVLRMLSYHNLRYKYYLKSSFIYCHHQTRRKTFVLRKWMWKLLFKYKCPLWKICYCRQNDMHGIFKCWSEQDMS